MSMHKIAGILAGILILMMQQVTAQSSKADSLRLQLRKDSAHIYRPRRVLLLLSLDQRNTFLETSSSLNTPVNLQGIRLGATIHQRSRTGIGAYRIRDSRARISRVNGLPVDVEFKFNYLTVFYEYYFLYSKYWNIGMPLEVGMGRYQAKDTSVNRQGILFPLGIGIDLQFKPTRWVGLNTMGGYRFVGNNNNLVKLNNWFYALGVSLNTRNIYDDSRYWLKRRKLKQELKKIKHGAD